MRSDFAGCPGCGHVLPLGRSGLCARCRSNPEAGKRAWAYAMACAETDSKSGPPLREA